MVILSQIHCSSLKTKETTDIDIQYDETMVSFDVVSLFTAIPVDKTYIYIRKKLENDPHLYSRTNLGMTMLFPLLNFVLSNNYFVDKDKICKIYLKSINRFINRSMAINRFMAALWVALSILW